MACPILQRLRKLIESSLYGFHARLALLRLHHKPQKLIVIRLQMLPFIAWDCRAVRHAWARDVFCLIPQIWHCSKPPRQSLTGVAIRYRRLFYKYNPLFWRRN